MAVHLSIRTSVWPYISVSVLQYGRTFKYPYFSMAVHLSIRNETRYLTVLMAPRFRM